MKADTEQHPRERPSWPTRDAALMCLWGWISNKATSRTIALTSTFSITYIVLTYNSSVKCRITSRQNTLQRNNVSYIPGEHTHSHIGIMVWIVMMMLMIISPWKRRVYFFCWVFTHYMVYRYIKELTIILPEMRQVYRTLFRLWLHKHSQNLCRNRHIHHHYTMPRHSTWSWGLLGHHCELSLMTLIQI